MRNKFIKIVIYALLAIIVTGILWLLISPLFSGERYDFYIRFFLLLYVLRTFGTLRLYNAIVQNTRFIIKLRDITHKFLTNIPLLDRGMRTLSSIMGSLKNSTDTTKRTIEKNIEALDELNKNFKNQKSKEK